MTNNLDLWDRVSKTDPDHTKSAGRFTAIDAYHQIYNATAEFGPVGEGWGWEIKSEQVIDGNAIVRIRFWWHINETGGQYEEYGTAQTGRLKDESFKAALTDAITKALSRLGFNADVFMGKFDNNKYVDERRQEVARDKAMNAKPKTNSDKTDMWQEYSLERQDDIQQIVDQYTDGKAPAKACINELNLLWDIVAKPLSELCETEAPAIAAELRTHFKTAREELAPSNPDQ